MESVWTRDTLESLFEHPSEEVRHWAISRALDLYADMCDQLVRLLACASPRIAWLILNRLARLAEVPIAQPDPLLEILRGPARADVKAYSAALLLRSGYSLPQSELEASGLREYAPGLAIADQGFDVLLDLYRTHGDNDKPIFAGLAEACGFGDLSRNLLQAKNAKEIRETREYLGELWGCEIPRLERFSRPADVLSAFEQALAMPVPEDNMPWKRGLLSELEHDRARLAAVHEIAKERVPKWSGEDNRFIQSCILCLWRNKACGDRLAEASGAPGLWRAIVMKPWRGVPGQELKGFLLSATPAELISSLSEALSEEYSYATCAFSILNALETPGRLQLFLDSLEGAGHILAEDAAEALKQAGPPAAQHIIEDYPQMSPQLRTLVLFVLDSLPTPQVVDFCLDHFEEYMRSPDSQEFVGCLGTIASRRFFDPLLQEWREGETRIGQTIKLISEIHNIKDQQIERIVQDTEEKTRHPEEFLDKPISSFPLRCTECGHTYHYELRNIYVDKKGPPVIADIIQCKGCGSIETYEMSVFAQFKITAELIRLGAAAKAQGKPAAPPDTPLKICDGLGITVLGRKVKSGVEAYHLLKSEIERHPLDADLQKRMGNVLKNGGKPELASPYFLEAIRLNPSDAESHYSIADILLNEGKFHEAIPYVEALVPLCREGKMDEELRRVMFSALLDQAFAVEKETGHKVELFHLATPEEIAKANPNEPFTLDAGSLDLSNPDDFELMYHLFRTGRVPKGAGPRAYRQEAVTRQPPATRPGKKIGRNDPCPCGSGKKYKKCCGR